MTRATHARASRAITVAITAALGAAAGLPACQLAVEFDRARLEAPDDARDAGSIAPRDAAPAPDADDAASVDAASPIDASAIPDAAAAADASEDPDG